MGLERGRVHRTPNLRALSYRFAVRSDDERLGRRVDALLAGLRDPVETAPVEHWYSLTAADDGRPAPFDVWRDGEVLARGQQPGDALGWVVWDVNRAAAEAGGDHLLFHAGGIEADGTGVLLPGASGSGKSTLVAGLVRAGLGYLTDELAALDMASGRLVPYAKPITVKPGSFAVLSDMDPDVGLEPGAAVGGPRVAGGGRGGHGTSDRATLRARASSWCPATTPAPQTALTPLSDTEAFFALALNAVNLIPHGSEGTRALGRLAKGCRCFSLTMSDLDDACRLVLDLVAPMAGARRRRRAEVSSVRPEWPDGRSRPVRREGAAAVELDDNVALYDDVGQLLIMLNSSAAAVWECCDGTTTLDDMVRELAEAHRPMGRP